MRRLVPVLVGTALLAGCAVTVTPVATEDTSGPLSTSSPTASAAPSGPASGSASPGSGATAGTDPALARFYGQRLNWSGCGGDFECATLTVPLDYADPGGDTIGIKVIRSRATGSDRLGSLVLNPGGPGGSGIDYARAARVVVSDAVRRQYDIVGFDPRGVGESDPVRCLTDGQTDAYFGLDGTPDTKAELDAMVQASEEYGQRCEARSAALLPHIGTPDAARDMDVLRAALGDEKLNYLGKSYGTYLGATYAELFPQRVGRLVLDGVLPPDLTPEQISLGQAKAFEVSLRHFVEWCQTRSDCPLPGNADEGVATVREFLKSLDSNPLPTGTDRELTEPLATYAVIYPMYAPQYLWGTLRRALADGLNGDGAALLQLFDEAVERNADGTYANNQNDALVAISCLDRPTDGGLARAEKLAADWSKVAPTFGASSAYGYLPCVWWPVKSTSKPHVIRAEGADPILVVSTTADPATPYEWGVSLAKQLANAALITRDGDGHTAYREGSQCVDDAVDAYLLQGDLPAGRDLRCTTQADIID